MKAVFWMFLILIVANCNAAKFPFHVTRRQDCDFCVPYMLEDCFCRDVEFCKSSSCEIPQKCKESCMVERDESFPASTRNLHDEDSPDCTFCVPYMLEDCICEDVAFCKSRSCEIPEKCKQNCP